jgi:hypothetical protein
MNSPTKLNIFKSSNRIKTVYQEQQPNWTISSFLNTSNTAAGFEPYLLLYPTNLGRCRHQRRWCLPTWSRARRCSLLDRACCGSHSSHLEARRNYCCCALIQARRRLVSTTRPRRSPNGRTEAAAEAA